MKGGRILKKKKKGLSSYKYPRSIRRASLEERPGAWIKGAWAGSHQDRLLVTQPGRKGGQA